MVLAKQVATLDQLSGGRLVVGVGVGSLPEENAAMGVVWDDRGAYSDESIEVMKALWKGQPATFTGTHFALDGIVASPRPAQTPHPPLLIGGSRPPALRRVARHGDGWHPLGLPPDSYARRLEELDGLLAAEGRTRADLVLSLRIDAEGVDREAVDAYADVGVQEMVVSVNSGDLGVIGGRLDRIAAEMMS
jgi:probable F420-dependent oxidoreductase